MQLILGVLMLLAGAALAFWLLGNVLGLLVMLFVSALVGFAAEAVVPGEQLTPGWMAATGAGLLGSLVGTLLLGRFGPVLFGVPLLPSLLGAVVVVAALALIRRNTSR